MTGFHTLLLAIVLGTAHPAVHLALAQGPEPGYDERYGMAPPRPADATRREQLGYAPPRAPTEVLAEIDAMSARMAEIEATDEAWKSGFRDYRRMQRLRINLISELEEAGYDGNRLDALLATKLEDIQDVGQRARFPLSAYDGLRLEMARRHEGRPAATAAQWWSMMDVIHVTRSAGLHIDPRDLERIAELETARAEHEDAGLLLLEALHGDSDEVLKAQWSDWMIENLGKRSRGYRSAMQARMFGRPIQLQSEGIDGAPIDTAEWRGDVILVDFWGTWCVPCIAAMPELQRMEDKYAGRGLRIVGVLCDHEIDRARAFLGQRGYRWPQMIDRSLTPENKYDHPIAFKYAVGAFPTLWIIDRDGVLREAVDREQLEETILKYLDRPAGK